MSKKTEKLLDNRLNMAYNKKNGAVFDKIDFKKECWKMEKNNMEFVGLTAVVAGINISYNFEKIMFNITWFFDM